MRSFLAVALLALTAGGSAVAELPSFLQEHDFADGTDLVVERTLVPGAVHRFEARSEGPLTINLVTIDMTRTDFVLETVGGRGGLAGLEPLSEMVARRTNDERQPVAAINADFFEWRGEPINLFVESDMIWRHPYGWNDPQNTRALYAFDEDGNHFIGNPEFAAVLASGNGEETIALDGINFAAEEGTATAYTWPAGELIPAAPEGAERVVVTLDGSRWVPNEPAPGTVTVIGENPPIPLSPNTVLVHLSGDFPAWLYEGATVQLDARLEGLPGPVVGAVGGGPTLVRDGEVVARQNEPIHPRTALGIKDDGTTLVFATVDGRQPGRSVGIGLRDLGHLMLEAGCIEALNLDGGGSTTMVLGTEISNFVSGERARTVSNALLLFRTVSAADEEEADATEPEDAAAVGAQ